MRFDAMFRRAAVLLIRFYQLFISPLKPPACRFNPTCSHYAIESIGVHGLVRGGALSAWRVLRCNPFVRGGYDPVPPGPGRTSPNNAAGAALPPEAAGPARRCKHGFQRD